MIALKQRCSNNTILEIVLSIFCSIEYSKYIQACFSTNLDIRSSIDTFAVV